MLDVALGIGGIGMFSGRGACVGGFLLVFHSHHCSYIVVKGCV